MLDLATLAATPTDLLVLAATITLATTLAVFGLWWVAVIAAIALGYLGVRGLRDQQSDNNSGGSQ